MLCGIVFQGVNVTSVILKRQVLVVTILKSGLIGVEKTVSTTAAADGDSLP